MEKHTWHHKGRSFDDGVRSMDTLFNQNREIRKAWHNGKVIWDSSKIQDAAWVSFKLPFLYTVEYLSYEYNGDHTDGIDFIGKTIKTNRIVLEVIGEAKILSGNPIIYSHGFKHVTFKMENREVGTTTITAGYETRVLPYLKSTAPDYDSWENAYGLSLKTLNDKCSIRLQESMFIHYYYDHIYLGSTKRHGSTHDFEIPKNNSSKIGFGVNLHYFNCLTFVWEPQHEDGYSLWIPFHYGYAIIDNTRYDPEDPDLLTSKVPKIVTRGPRVGLYATADDTMYLSTPEELSNFKCSPNATFEFE